MPPQGATPTNQYGEQDKDAKPARFFYNMPEKSQPLQAAPQQ